MAFWKYVKAAFVNRWNLVLFLGSCGFAAISGHADIAIPLVMAGEVGYLGFVGTHPKFQKYIDIQQAGIHQAEQSDSSQKALIRIMNTLPPPAKVRFDRLRARCLELRQIAADLKQARAANDGPLESLQTAGLDRLLWVFLRLLFTQFSIARFLARTTREEIQTELQQVEKRIAGLSPNDPSPFADKVRRALEDHLQTSQERLSNFDKAKANHELVGLELDRLENKITSLAELAVNRQEPDYIAGQVDQVATSMRETERTMNELDFATGLGQLDEAAPSLLPPISAS